MSRKDYEALAAIIKRNLCADGGVDDEQLFQTASDMADYFESTNSSFNRTLFMDACGL